MGKHRMASLRCQVSERSHRWLTLVILLVCLSGLCVLGKHSRKKGFRAEQSHGHLHEGQARGEEVEKTRGHSHRGPAEEREVEQTRGHPNRGPAREKEVEQTRGKPHEDLAREEGARIAQIRERLLQQLGIAELPTDPEEYVEEVSEETKEEYHILVDAQSRELLTQSAVGANEHETLEAQKVSSFRGDIVEVYSRG